MLSRAQRRASKHAPGYNSTLAQEEHMTVAA